MIQRAARAAWAGGAALILAACCSCGGSSPSGGSVNRGTSGPQFSLSEINNTFSAMSALQPLAARGTGRIAVLLPEAASATFFADIAAPDFKESFQKAGLEASQYTVELSATSDQLSDAEKAILHADTRVLIVDARYSNEGNIIENYARAHGVQVIDYDWLTIGGTRNYYVGFDSLKVGVLLGQGLVSCASAWGVTHPRVIVMRGDPNDYNSALYAQGYDTILARQFSRGWKDAGNPPGTWDPIAALSEFQQQYSADTNINAALTPNDATASPIISYLRSKGIKPRTFPVTGLDASLSGLQNTVAEYQCGTVYKPIYLEAQAAAALAMYVRAGVTPPPDLLNWNTTDPQTNTPVPSVLLTPEWVTAENIESTVIADKSVSPSSLCAGMYAPACVAAGISS
jgi:D-xylose transport system substrate-binding protein